MKNHKLPFNFHCLAIVFGALFFLNVMALESSAEISNSGGQLNFDSVEECGMMGGTTGTTTDGWPTCELDGTTITCKPVVILGDWDCAVIGPPILTRPERDKKEQGKWSGTVGSNSTTGMRVQNPVNRFNRWKAPVRRSPQMMELR